MICLDLVFENHSQADYHRTQLTSASLYLSLAHKPTDLNSLICMHGFTNRNRDTDADADADGNNTERDREDINGRRGVWAPKRFLLGAWWVPLHRLPGALLLSQFHLTTDWEANEGENTGTFSSRQYCSAVVVQERAEEYS